MTKQNSLAGCYAKLNRADELIASLKLELHLFLNTEPKPFRVRGEHRNNDREFHLVAYGPPPPLRFSVLAGEIIHHLRSSLDHVVWACANYKSNNASTRLQFPICKSKDEFDKSIKNGTIKGVGPDAAAVVDSVQPFRQTSPRDTILYALHRASIVDKHRLLLVVAGVGQIAEKITIGDVPGRQTTSAGNVEILGMSPPTKTSISEEGGSVFVIYFGNPAPNTMASAEIDFTVAFDELGEARNVELIKGLNALLEGTRHTVAQFSNVF